MTSIYIHIPFCSRICSYCDFPKKISKSQEIDTYLDCLYEEIKMYDVKDGVKTLYLGGGTPSILSTEQFKKLKKIISLFKLDASYEFTIECNPEHVTEEKVVMLKELGINRVSLGVQTFNDELLKILNRGHNKDTVYQAVDILRKKGIDNINLDLIFAIPNQTMKDVINDLKHIHKLNIPHISYYSFILEDKTVLHYLYQQNKLELVDNDIEAKMYLKVIKTLKKFYYMHYEISNFAQPGYSSRHNLTYWHNQNYYGFGMGASGYINNIRYYNENRVNRYINRVRKKELPIIQKDIIDKDTKIKEALLLGLRLIDGVNIEKLNSLYNVNIQSYFAKEFNYLEKEGLIEIDKNIKLTAKGLLLGNEVFEHFI